MLKNITIFLSFCIVLALSLPVPASYADSDSALGKNLLSNASFENQLANWRVQIGARWTANLGFENSGGLIIETSIPADHERFHETTLEQCVRLLPGEKYQLRAKFKTETPLTDDYAENAKFANRVNLIWYESPDCDSGGQFGGWIEAKNVAGWQDLLQSHLFPAFGAKAAKIVVVQNALYARSIRAYWDDIEFYVSEIDNQPPVEDRIEPSDTLPMYENYIKNGNFNANIEAWHAYKTSWSRFGNTEPGSAKVSFGSDEGGYGTGALSQCINIGENVKFELGASVSKDFSSSQNGAARIRVSWNNKRNCKGHSKTDTKYADINTFEGWHKLVVKNLVAPENTRSVRVEIIQSIAGPGIFSLYWDDVYFMAVR